MVICVYFNNNNEYKIKYEEGMKLKKKKKIEEYFSNLFNNMVLPTKGYIAFFPGEHCSYENYSPSWCSTLNMNNDVDFSWSEVGNVNTLLPAYNILNKTEQQEDKIDYEDKIDCCMYRFSVLFPSRIECVDISKTSELFDIKWVYKDNIPENINHKGFKHQRKKNELSKEEMCKHKVQLDCYGWEAFYWKCKTNCVVLRWCNPFERTFIDNYLKPNYHYFCVDASNLESTMDYVLRNPTICKKMINARLKIMNEKLSIESMKNDAVNLIHDYINCRF